MTTTERDDMSFNQAQLRALMGNLNPKRVKSRKQGGSTLSYLEAYDIRASLIRVFGFGNFSVETLRSDLVRWDYDIPRASGSGTVAFRVVAMATVQVTLLGTGAVFSETAVASQSGADPGEVADFAIKTAVSDAMKRCAINLGTQFGLSLYNSGSTQDVVAVVLEPEQAATLAGVVGEDPTPDGALPIDDEDEPGTVEAAVEAWRVAKRDLDSNAPGASPEKVAELAALARKLKDEAEGVVPNEMADAVKSLKEGFGG